MTVAEYFVRLTRVLSQKVPAAMSDENKQWLVDAANLGLMRFTNLLPELRKVQTRTERLVAPVVKSIEVTQGSKTISFTGGWADAVLNLGRTVVVGNDGERYNRLASAAELQHSCEGVSGATTLEVLSDAVLIGVAEGHWAGDVMLQEGGSMTQLTHGRPGHLTENDVLRVSRGRPEYWWVEPLNAMSNGIDPKFVMRLWPQPETFFQIRFATQLWPTGLTVVNLASTAVLPLRNGEEALLVDIAIEGLIHCPLWVGTANKEDSAAAAKRAEAIMRGEGENRGHTKPAKIHTKRGY